MQALESRKLSVERPVGQRGRPDSIKSPCDGRLSAEVLHVSLFSANLPPDCDPPSGDGISAYTYSTP
jgi:hypothetical protein